MKTNPTIIHRPLITAALLLTLIVGLSSCDSAEPLKPASAYGPILPPVIPDTLTVNPPNPEPIHIGPITKLPDSPRLE